MIVKNFLSPNPPSASTSVSRYVCEAAHLILSAMKDYWCRCDKCNGGKLVAKSTWYSHNPKGARQGQSIHPRGSPSPRRSPFPDTEPGPMDIDVIEPPGDLDPLGKVSQATLSDFVGIACLSYQFSLPCFI